MAKNLIHQSPWLVLNKADEKTAEIDITGIIGDDYGYYWDDAPDSANTSDKMRAELKAIAELKVDKIIINIDSVGGSVSHGLSIHDLLVQNKAKKEVRIIGMTASIATVIAQAGDIRKMSDNALLLIHKPMLMAAGNENDLNAAVDELKVVKNKITGIYTKRSGKELSIFEDLISENNGMGRWLEGKEAQEFGLIDEVIEPVKMVAQYDEKLINKFKYPQIPQNYLNKMNEEQVKTFGQKLDALTEKVTNFFEGKSNQELTDASGAKFLLEKKSGDPAIGDKATPDGVFNMSDGKAITIKDSKIFEVKEKLEESEDVKNLRTENESLNTKVVDMETQIQSFKDEEAAFKAKETEADGLISELSALKNDWKPEGRTTNPGATSVNKGLDKDQVKENLKKLKDKK